MKRDKEGRFVKGFTPWNKNKKGYSTCLKDRKRPKGFKEKIKKAMNRPEVREKCKKSWFKKGHVGWNKGIPRSERARKKMSITRKRLFKEGKIRYSNLKPNKPELKFLELIKKHKLPFKYTGDGKFWIENINPDFVECNGKKICLEIFGDYFHNPLRNIGLKWNRTEKGRKEILKKYGWKCIIIWEHELKNEQKVLEKIRKI